LVGVLAVEQSTVVEECTHANGTCDYPVKLSSVLKTGISGYLESRKKGKAMAGTMIRIRIWHAIV
jgi:hypothetical protein